jgi:hypothetical protein
VTTREYRAIGYYAAREGLRLGLSRPPLITFIDDAALKEVPLWTILAYYDNGRKEDAKERAKQRRSENAAANNRRRVSAY